MFASTVVGNAGAAAARNAAEGVPYRTLIPIWIVKTDKAIYFHGVAIARCNRLWVIFCTRSSGPCGRDQCDQGSVWPGGEERPCAQKIVEALNTKLPFGPG